MIIKMLLFHLIRHVVVAVCLRLCMCPMGGLEPMVHHFFGGNINRRSIVPIDRLFLVLL